MSPGNWKRSTHYANHEQVLKRQICDYITRRRHLATMYPGHRGVVSGGQVKHYHSPYMPAGVADIIACIFGEYHEIEVKRPAEVQRSLFKGDRQKIREGVLSHAQIIRKDTVRYRGGRYHVVTSLEQVDRLIRRVETKHKLINWFLSLRKKWARMIRAMQGAR